MSYIKKHKEGLTLAVVFHLLVLLIILNSSFFTPLPLPEEKGFMVDFGNTDQGFGAEEPAPSNIPVHQQQASIPEPVTPKVAKPVPSNVQPVLTQDYEQSAAVEEAKQKKKIEDEQKRQEEDKVRQANLEKQRQLLAEAEKRRADSIRRAQDAAKANAINSMAQGAFNKGTGGAGTSTSGGQGSTYGGGNQGTPSGTAGAGTYGAGGGAGISFSLSGRSGRSMVKPTYTENDEGIVVVEITVDIHGNVTAAAPGARGTTTNNQKLWEAAKKAALLTKFSANSDAPVQLKGTITYKFTLN